MVRFYPVVTLGAAPGLRNGGSHRFAYDAALRRDDSGMNAAAGLQLFNNIVHVLFGSVEHDVQG